MKLIPGIATAAAILMTLSAYAQTDNGAKNINKLCGCFSVNFKYAETFSPDAKYKFHDREDLAATELVLPVEQTNKKIVLQHLLVINDSMIIKHWREEWEYEQPVLYVYAGNKVWNKTTLSAEAVKGKWTQTVWEVSDEPRYQGVSAWISNDGKTYWESTADAPLPRREYSVRSDYNIMKRHNRIVVSDSGYVHEQDNDKIIRNDGTDKLLVQEKGFNIYYKDNETECAAAKAWWKKNEAFWTVVRHEWQQSMAAIPVVAVKAKVDDKRLDEYLTALWTDWSSHKIAQAELPGKVKDIITRFL